MGIPDTFKVDRLTNEKASHIAIRDDYQVTGYVMTRVVGKENQKCIVDCSAVRWMGMTEFFEMMHPPQASFDTIVEQYQLVDGKMTRTLTNNDAYVRSVDYNRMTQKYAKLQFKLAMLETIKPKGGFPPDGEEAARRIGWNECLAAIKAALEFQP